MFIDTMPGLDAIFENDIPRGKLILVTGKPGTLKTGFIHSVLNKALKNNDEYGLYITLEESKEDHLENMRSLGIRHEKRLHISDFTDIRDEIDIRGDSVDYLQLIEQTINYYNDEVEDKFTCFALDSLNALYSLMDIQNLRREMFRFFRKLKVLNLTSFIVKEVPENNLGDFTEGGEGYLADGIIELGYLESRESVTRYIQVKKMRTASHSMKKFQIEVTPKGLAVVGEAYTP